MTASADNNGDLSDVVSIDYENQILYVESSKDSVIGFATTTLKNKVVSAVKDTAWEWYDNTSEEAEVYGVQIDLSTLSSAKDNYIQIKGDVSEPVTLKIPAAVSAAKAAYEAYADKVYYFDTTKKKAVADDMLQYRTQYGRWVGYANDEGTSIRDSLSKFTARGASLTFRVRAVVPDALTKIETTGSSAEFTTADKSPAYQTGTFPGKEVKVKIAKAAAGPKATINYTKDQIALPVGAKYRLVQNGTTPTQYQELSDSWKTVAANDKKKAVPIAYEEIRDSAEAGGVIEAYIPEATPKAAVDETKAKVTSGKSKSMISRTEFKAFDTTYVKPVATLTPEEEAAITKAGTDAKSDYESAGGDSTSEGNKIQREAEANKREEIYASKVKNGSVFDFCVYKKSEEESPKLDTSVTDNVFITVDYSLKNGAASTVDFTNKSYSKFEVFAGEEKEGKWEYTLAGTISAGALKKGTETFVPGSAKISVTKLADKFVFIRKAAVSTKSEVAWATERVCMGKFTTPVAVETITVAGAGNATTVEVNKTLQLTASVIGKDNAAVDAKISENCLKGITWKSANTKIATVDKTGLVKGLKADSKVKITASANDGSKKKAEIEITVQKETPAVTEVTTVTVNAPEPEGGFVAGGEYMFTATTNGDDKTVTWSIDGEITGVSINSSTGVLTIGSEVEVGTEIKVKATSGNNVSGTAEITTVAAADPDPGNGD